MLRLKSSIRLDHKNLILVATKMRKRPLSLVLVSFVACVLVSIFVGSYWATKSRAEVKSPAESAKRNLNLKPTYRLGQRAQTVTSSKSVTKALSIATGDFDRDTAPDLIIGYGTTRGTGSITLQRGNQDAFVPKEDAMLQRLQQGYDPPSFLDDTKTYSLPERIDLLSVGDFNDDGNQDVLAGSTGGGLYLLTGSRNGTLSAPQHIEVGGRVTSLTTGEFGEPDGLRDVAVGVDGSAGPQVLIFDGASGGLQGNPRVYTAAGTVKSLALTKLDEDQAVDLVFVAGDALEIIHGAQGPATPERISLPFAVNTLAVGDFINDRNADDEISVLAADGTLQILRRSDLDTRPYTEAEQTERLRNRANVHHEITRLGNSEPVEWLVAGQFGSGLSPDSKLIAAHISSASTADLVVLGGSNQPARLLVSDSPGVGTSQKSDGSLSVSSTGFSLSSSDSTIAALPIQRKANGVRDIVMIDANQDIATIVPLAPTNITVDRTDDNAAASACTGAPNDCSLRGAIAFANTAANIPATINVPPGTYQLTIDGSAETGFCGLPGVGDLDLSGDGTTILGAGAAITVIQQTQPNDRVMCVDQNLVGNFDFTMSGVTIAGGRDTFAVGGGGVVSGGASDITTINSCVFTNNRVSGAGSPVGAGLANGRGSLTVANTTFGGAAAPCIAQTTLGCGNQAQASGGGIYQSVDLDTSKVFTIASSTFQNNISTQGNGAGLITSSQAAGSYATKSITDSTFTANIAQAASVRGGGAYNESGGTMSIVGSTFVNNAVTNVTGAGGGAVASADGANHDVSIVFSRFIGNSAGTPSNGLTLRGGTTSTMTANNNWWGVNSGPPANHVNNAIVATWLQLRNLASPNTVLLGGSSTLTADFFVNSASASVNGSNLFALAGLPVTWNNAQKGTLSNQVNSITSTVRNISSATEAGTTVTITTATNHGFSTGQTVAIAGVSIAGYNGSFTITGTPTPTTFTYTSIFPGLIAGTGGTATVPIGSATATFTAGINSASCGSGGADATVDNQVVTATVIVQCPDLTANKTNDVAGVAVVGQTWTWTQAISNASGAASTAANFANGQTILVDNLPNSPDISYTLLTPSIALGGVNSGTVDCSINGTKDLTCTANGAVVIGVGGTFNVQWTAKANVVGTYANPRGGGVSQVDPNDNVIESNEANNNSSNSVTVNKANTTTTITNAAGLSGTPSVTGQPVTVTWSVAVNAPGSLGALLTGNVTVQSGADSCTAAISAGQCDITFTTAGAKTVTAQYAGDTNYNGSTSASAPHTVNKADTTTTITNAATLTGTPSVTGQAVNVTWSVTVNAPGSVGAALSGNVTVSDGTNQCVAAVSAGNCNITFTSAGSKSLTAIYAGDANYNTSSSAPVSHTVNAANTTTTITNAGSLAGTPSVTGQSVNVTWSTTVNVPGSLGVALTGNVTVTDGTSNCTAAVAAGQCSITFTTAGAKSLTASYAGDANYNGSISATASHTVNPANTTISITNGAALTGTPSVTGQGVAVQWSVAVSAPGTLQAALTGNVTVSSGGDNCTAAVSAGQCTITFTSAGAKTITATYAGDSNYNGSTSAGVSHTVNKATTTTTITSDAPDPSSPGQLVTVNFNVTAIAPGAGIPTGNVNVTVSGGVESCTGTVATGNCSLVLNTLGVGRTITASYVGDSNFLASSGTASHDVIPANPNVSVLDARIAEPTSGTTNMLFTVALSSPAPGPITVDYATAVGGPNPATPGSDYTAITTTTLTFSAGQQIKTIPVQILADADNSETDETLLLNLSNPTGAVITDGQGLGTITVANTPGTFLISELRTSGPSGAGDDFVELYNNTNSPLTVTASDASAGYGVFKKGADCDSSPVLIATIPNGTVIPARGHYLLVGSGYSLANYGGVGAAAGDLTLTSDIESDANVAVFSTADVANLSSVSRLDAVGFGTNTGGAVCDLLREGTTLGPVAGSTLEYSFQRDVCGKGGNIAIFGVCPSSTPVDTNNNSTDFLFADTQATSIAGLTQRLGAPAPENLGSPIVRNSSIATSLVDPGAPASGVPNRVRDFTADPANNSTFGTLTIRRAFTNNTGAPITRLRFRIIDITSFPTPPGIADLRVRTSTGAIVPLTGGGNATVQGLNLETPPTQPNGGAVNSSLSAGTVNLGTPLASGATINVEFLLGIQATGSFRFYVNIEALP